LNTFLQNLQNLISRFFDADEADSLDRNAESERLKHETSKIISVMNRTKHVLIDGSIVPSYLEMMIKFFKTILRCLKTPILDSLLVLSKILTVKNDFTS